MKENVLDVLVYLFENYIADEVEQEQDQDSLKNELSQAGFSSGEIAKAFLWLEGLTALQEGATQHGTHSPLTTRVYTHHECEKLDVECRGLLIYLEQVGVLDQRSRELVIDRIMALGSEDVDTDIVKWVILMVLFNQPGQEEAYAWMEDFVFEEAPGQLH